METEVQITTFTNLPPYLQDMVKDLSNTPYGQVIFTINMDKGMVTDVVTTYHVRKRYSGNNK